MDTTRRSRASPGAAERQRSLWVTKESLEHCLAEQSLEQAIVGEDVADAALFLASGSARMISGQSLIVDGGRALA